MEVLQSFPQERLSNPDTNTHKLKFSAPMSITCNFINLFYCCHYFAGHSDVVMGLVSVNREDLYERLKFLQNGE